MERLVRKAARLGAKPWLLMSAALFAFIFLPWPLAVIMGVWAAYQYNRNLTDQEDLVRPTVEKLYEYGQEYTEKIITKARGEKYSGLVAEKLSQALADDIKENKTISCTGGHHPGCSHKPIKIEEWPEEARRALDTLTENKPVPTFRLLSENGK